MQLVTVVRQAVANQADDEGRVLVLLEGIHDVEFLARISRVLSQHDPSLPDMAALQRQQKFVLLPLGGNGPQAWLLKLASLGRAAFVLFDREVLAESRNRRRAITALNSCREIEARISSKRSIENYLHPQAIYEASGISVDIGDFDAVPEIVAIQRLRDKGVWRPWRSFSTRTRKRLRDRAKRWLNRDAVDCMTPERLASRDPEGEVVGWLRTIANSCESA